MAERRVAPPEALMPGDIITLLTDFGTADSYVAEAS